MNNRLVQLLKLKAYVLGKYQGHNLAMNTQELLEYINLLIKEIEDEQARNC